jgi:hypothetical protein
VPHNAFRKDPAATVMNRNMEMLRYARTAFLCLFFLPVLGWSQLTQTVRGKITDKVTGGGLPGVIVRSGIPGIHTVSDSTGRYRLQQIPVGRQSFAYILPGYRAVTLTDVIITSGKEAVLDVEMEESAVALDEAEITANSDTSMVSSMQAANIKVFSIEETERYPGSRQDPARMAQNFAGIQGTNDSRNDIVVRGNSPAGLLWRLEEIDIPNPSHFAVAGSAGGPQSIINNKYLSNSEFYTGAFPANYGNALGGVFDLKMRNGNNEKHERTLQFGILGTELSFEGPLSRASGASYMVTYRYSTLALFGSMNVKLGTSAIPYYQDGSVRINLPTKKAGVFSFSGIGGISIINILLSGIKERPQELYGDQNRDQKFWSDMGTGILSHVIQVGKRSTLRTSLAYSTQRIGSRHNLVIRDTAFIPNDTTPEILHYDFYENRLTLSSFIRSKLNSRNSIKAGFYVTRFDVNFFDKVRISSLYDTLALKIEGRPFKVRELVKTDFFLVQPYVLYVHQFTSRLSANAGVYSQYTTLGSHVSVEPRASLRYQPDRRNVLSLSYGLHSQMQATYLYFTIPDSVRSGSQMMANSTRREANRDLDFTKSHHFVAGYDYLPARYLRIKTELYYQWIYNVPVYVVPSSYSALNRGATFNRFYPVYELVNSGTGYNYGIELTVEKLYHRNYFCMMSASLFESKYTGSNGVTANTDFNGNYMVNGLAGMEYNVGKGGRNVISFGGKLTVGGGKRYSPVNIAASNAVMDVVPVDEKVNTLQFTPYNRVDLRVSYRINGRKMTTEIAVDLLNILNTKNILALSYTPDPRNRNAEPFAKNYQLGFLPLFYVKFDF